MNFNCEIGSILVFDKSFSVIFGRCGCHGNRLSGRRFGAKYFSDMTFVPYILNINHICEGRFPTFPKFVWSLERITLKSAPFFGDLKIFQQTKDNSPFYILKLCFLLHDNRFSCSVTSLLNISLQSWCILFKIRIIDVFWPNWCFLLLS